MQQTAMRANSARYAAPISASLARSPVPPGSMPMADKALWSTEATSPSRYAFLRFGWPSALTSHDSRPISTGAEFEHTEIRNEKRCELDGMQGVAASWNVTFGDLQCMPSCRVSWARLDRSIPVAWAPVRCVL